MGYNEEMEIEEETQQKKMNLLLWNSASKPNNLSDLSYFYSAKIEKMYYINKENKVFMNIA